MIHLAKKIRYGLAGISLLVTVGNVGFVATTHAQDTATTQPAAPKPVRDGGRDPFKKYEAPRVSANKVTRVSTTSIQERIAQYKAQKVAAMNARMAAPKPTTALLLSEIEIVGISRTPRGYAAIVEATPIKLSYVIYPGERFYDGQLVAIEDNRLVFRREIVLSDGRRERSVETKSLRQPNTVNMMSAAKTAPTSSQVADSEKPSEQSAAPAKPE
jgi:hypothetical protein